MKRRTELKLNKAKLFSKKYIFSSRFMVRNTLGLLLIGSITAGGIFTVKSLADYSEKQEMVSATSINSALEMADEETVAEMAAAYEITLDDDAVIDIASVDILKEHLSDEDSFDLTVGDTNNLTKGKIDMKGKFITTGKNVNIYAEAKDEAEVVALDHASFSVEKGEFVAIVGASGSGKSTLLHLIGGVDRPTSGKVIIDGKDISELDDDKLAIFRRRQVGLIYQFYNLIPILNVEENITLPLSLDNKDVDKKNLDELLKLLGLTDRRKHLPHELSGGQQQRTSIGRALITNPSIILADEPTGNLDSKSSDEIVALLKKSNKERAQTIVMITHNMEIAKMADRIIKIEDGRLSEV